MADNIRGLTVEISADASSFNKEMSSMRKAAQSSQSELNALQKSLELEFNADKFARAQKVAQQAIDQTAANADALRRRLDYLKKTDNVDTDGYRKLQAELAKTELQGQQLETQLKKINQIKFDALSSQVSKVGKGFESAGRALTPLSTAAGAAVAGLGALGLKAVSTADDVATLATQYDMSAEALQKFNYVALQTDTESESLYKAFVKVRAGIADIASGTTSIAGAALQKLNLDFNAFDGSEEQFYAIIDALATMTDKTQMVAVANDIFGDKLANNILPLIYAGTDAVNTYCAEYDELGALTNEQVNALAEFDNVLNKIKTQFSNIAAQIGAALLPLMQTLADVISNSLIPKLQKLAEWFGALSVEQQSFIVKALLVVAALAPLAIGIGKIITLVGSIIKILPVLNSALATLAANPIILIIAAIAAVVLILYTQCEAFRESINNLIVTLTSALEPILNVIFGLINKVMSLLSPIISLIGGILATIINMITTALQPFIDIISVLFELLSPLIDIALIPLTLALNQLKIPLQIIGQLLNWLTPLFEVFGKVVLCKMFRRARAWAWLANWIFKGIMIVVNTVLGWVESAVNWCIGIINKLIDGVNAALGWLGVNIQHIGEVKLRLDTSEVEDLDDVNAVVNSTSDGEIEGGTVYDNGGIETTGDVYNYDNSTTTTTQNVTVTIQNYAAEVDTDKLVNEINIKLAEAM